jgi:hypothetical protein
VRKAAGAENEAIGDFLKQPKRKIILGALSQASPMDFDIVSGGNENLGRLGVK